jgi:SAM-dependent methyltransferase/uncharacterized protein YbaR (Trm112 family)
VTPSSNHGAWYLENLVCPRDHARLSQAGETITCERGHTYPVLDGIPIMLLSESDPEHGSGAHTLEQVKTRSWTNDDPVHEGQIDPYVQRKVAATCGRMFLEAIGELPRYPIPEIRLPPAQDGAWMLDIGCGWGRWSIAASRKGYSVVGIDVSLDAVRAARRVSSQLGAPATFVVADARFLPFPSERFEMAFSYSFLQHLSKTEALQCVDEIARVLTREGEVLAELPNSLGALNAARQVRRGFRDPGGFGVRYWRPAELSRAFADRVGPTSLSVDSYFFINGQPSDRDLFPRRFRILLSVSEKLRALSERHEWMTTVADSLYVHSTRGRTENARSLAVAGTPTEG